MSNIRIMTASEADIPIILRLINALAEYEELAHTVRATYEKLRESLFGSHPAAEVLLAYWNEECAGFAVFFTTYSTFLAARGVYLEDLFVVPHLRGRGIGLGLMKHLARLSVERCCERLEWGVLRSNQPAIEFYKSLDACPLDNWTKYRLSGEQLHALAGN
jgi:GNAT superfamily N-acetyltransferase